MEKVAEAAARRLYRLTMGLIRRVGQTTTPITPVTSLVTEGITRLPENKGDVQEEFFTTEYTEFHGGRKGCRIKTP